MLLLDEAAVPDLLDLVPGAEVLEIPEWILTADPAAEYPTVYGDHPPYEWFTSLPAGFGPDDQPYIDEEGRVAAVAWPYDRCHVGYTDAGLCVTLPPSPTGNHLFHQGNTITAEGIRIPTGFLGLHGHDQNPAHTIQQAQAFYNDPLNAGARGRILETPEAAYFVGAIKPGVTFGQVETIRGGALSGDWRWIPELDAYDALGPCLVARPGLPTTYRADAGQLSALELVYEVTEHPESGMIVSTPAWAIRSLEEIQAMAGARNRKIVVVGGHRPPVKALAEGMTYEDQRSMLHAAVREQFGTGEDSYVWMMDFDDTSVIFESEGMEGDTRMMVGYSINGTEVTFAGEPTPVKVQYVPVGSSTIEAAAGTSCGCKPKRPIQAEGGGNTDDRVAELEVLVAELQAKLARMEAEETPVDEIVNLPDEDSTGEPAEETSAA